MSKYTFKADIENKTNIGSCGLQRIYEDSSKDVLVLGQMITLFGQPQTISENFENQYSYSILAEDENGKTAPLSVYSGEIGGLDDEVSKQAAKELADYIKSAVPSDYDYVGYYMDVPVKVKLGIKDGRPYQGGEPLELSDEEFSQLYKKLYDL